MSTNRLVADTSSSVKLIMQKHTARNLVKFAIIVSCTIFMTGCKLILDCELQNLSGNNIEVVVEENGHKTSLGIVPNHGKVLITNWIWRSLYINSGNKTWKYETAEPPFECIKFRGWITKIRFFEANLAQSGNITLATSCVKDIKATEPTSSYPLSPN
jgi:hypothetical protein